MKLYEKIIDGQRQYKPASKIIIIKDGMQTFNPTEEMLFEDGWKIFNKEDEVPLEVLFAEAKREVLNEIMQYDSSEHINVFYVNGINMWLDKATRVGLKLRFDAELESAKTETTLWYMGNSFLLNLDAATKMLNAIEVYASKCYDQTQYHLSEVNKLTSIEEIRNYDYKVGYPEKLQFNF